jgi:hypothetical protein
MRSLPILVEWRTQNKNNRNIRKANHKDLEIVITQLHLQILHLTLSSTRESRELRIASNKESGLEGGSKEPWVVTTKNQGQRERKKSCD